MIRPVPKFDRYKDVLVDVEMLLQALEQMPHRRRPSIDEWAQHIRHKIERIKEEEA